MKLKLLIAAALVLCTFTMPAMANKATKAAQKNYKKKLAEPFMKKVSWFTDYDKAKAESKKTGKPMFAYFTRSYAP